MKRQKNMMMAPFAACADGVRLLIFLSEAARRATAGGWYWEFSSAGGYFRDDFAPPMNGTILKRREIFRGKISGRNNQNKNKNKTYLEERTHSRQNP